MTTQPEMQSFTVPKPYTCADGQVLNGVTLCYNTWGTLNTAAENAIWIHHSLSTDCHLASHDAEEAPGWWEKVVGPGKAIDTDRFFVICANNLGSCFGSTGPVTINAATGKPYGSDFPHITIADMVHTQKQLLDHLGITRLYAAIGSSMGGMLSLAWTWHYPDTVARLISISSCYKTYPVNHALRELQRQIIRTDPLFDGGNYTDPCFPGMLQARHIGHLTYRSWQELNQRFPDYKGLQSYLSYNARKFCQQFDPNTYLCLTQAMDDFDLTTYWPPANPQWSRISADTLIISVDSDRLFAPNQQQDLFEAMRTHGCKAQLHAHHSDFGHDAFYADRGIAQVVADFLAN